ncbi:MAG: tRNA uridine-5-carboxymethylaminomethyl(34) synthesis enzyme MnmG [Clostridiales bacterium]|nr:tRNA uridine-5-carboxymethylaminomethyl(34) synthesis enzyme MnmG [Clostridiales bacterium]
MVANEQFEVAVIGAGHAGVEACLAAARMGRKTALLTLNADSIGLMPCNPAIGGTGKGHLVRELDALGGEMGLAADDTCIQVRMLNLGKGPAVHSLRAQMDKRRYHERVKRAVEAQENLTLIQAEVTRIQPVTSGGFLLYTQEGMVYFAAAIVLAMGVYLKSRILVGDTAWESGPAGLQRSEGLSDSLQTLGFTLQRFKTGTPARVLRESLDVSEMEAQYGENPAPAFSFLHQKRTMQQDCCWLTYTNAQTHQVILDNLHRSPMYSGKIHAAATRYCPSIEDKIVKFADKDRHQLFIEPEGRSTSEMYVQGMSTSLPADVQLAMLRTVPGLRNCRVVRWGYAIEYDCLTPTELTSTLMARNLPGLFTAGQLNGSSGYEEAAAQGLLAGINAACFVLGEEPLTLSRSEAYLGVLVDDLTLRGTAEPYRMMTSRCEYRLLLRQDNADLRLTEKARRFALVSDLRYEKLVQKRDSVEKARQQLRGAVSPGEALETYLAALGEPMPKNGSTLWDLLKRPQVCYTDLQALFSALDPLPEDAEEQIDALAHYDGYIQKQMAQVERERALENTALPPDLDYSRLDGLRLEARQKLAALRPGSVGQAKRVSGVSPADVSVLLIYAKRGFDTCGAKKSQAKEVCE